MLINKSIKTIYILAVILSIAVLLISNTSITTAQTGSTPTNSETEYSNLSADQAVGCNDDTASNNAYVAFGRTQCTGEPGDFEWKTLKVGAGGWVTGISISDDGVTKAVRTDTHGAYVLDPDNTWRQIINADSLPPEEVEPVTRGLYAIAVAPSDHNRIYVAFNGFVYRSDNRGYTMKKTALQGLGFGPNDAYRFIGLKMIVDPINPDVVYFGEQGGQLRVTEDGGDTWRIINDVPTSNEIGFVGYAFDRTSGTANGKTNRLYVGSSGNGVYVTNDGGNSWSPVAGSRESMMNMKVSADGVLYVVSFNGVGGSALDGGEVWRYENNTWTQLTTAGQWIKTISVNPNNPSHLVATRHGGNFMQSFDKGNTWNADMMWSVSRVANDVPWLAVTDENHMSNGDVIFDPVVPDKLWFTEGIGVWNTTVYEGMRNIEWTSISAGIEQLVMYDVAKPPGGDLLISMGDRGLFRIEDPDQYPTYHYPEAQFNYTKNTDWSHTDPSFIVHNTGWRLGSQAGFSTDGGNTIEYFNSYPENSGSPWTWGFGHMAVSTPGNIVWVPTNNNWPYYTTDNGNTWNPVSFDQLTRGAAGEGEFHFAHFLRREVVASDKVADNVFYLVYNGGGDGSKKGFYRSTDGGATFQQTYNSDQEYPRFFEELYFSNFNSQLEAVPGYEGHLFYTGGDVGAEWTETPDDFAFMRSTDGGFTWNEVGGSRVREVYKFGFGKPRNVGDYPTIYIVGWVDGDYGVWMTEDEGVNWDKIGEYTFDNTNEVRSLTGDMDEFGIVYIVHGNGATYGRIQE